MKRSWIPVLGIFVLALTIAGIVSAQAPAQVAGTWTMTNEGRGGTVTSTLTIMQDGSALKGTLKGMNGMEIPLEDASVNGNNITFTVTRMGRGGEVKVKYDGTVAGDTMMGTFAAGQNTVNWSAKKG